MMYGSLDILRFILCLMICLIHLPFDLPLNQYLMNGLLRIAVPLFFILSGFFLASDKDKLKASIIKNIKILLLFELIYLMQMLPHLLSVFGFNKSISTILNFYLGGSLFGSHLWFIRSLIIASIIIFAFKNKILNNKKISLLISAALYLIACGIFYKYPIITDTSSIHLVRNSLFIGLPFMTIGLLIRNSSITLTTKTKILLLITFTILAFIELSYISSNILQKGIEYFLMLYLICPLIFIIVKDVQMKQSYPLLRKTSMYIYLIHYYIFRI